MHALARARADEEETTGNARPGPLDVSQVRKMTSDMLRRFYNEAMGAEGVKLPAHERKQAAKSYSTIVERWLALESRPAPVVEAPGEQTPALLELARRLAEALGGSPSDENVR